MHTSRSWLLALGLGTSLLLAGCGGDANSSSATAPEVADTEAGETEAAETESPVVEGECPGGVPELVAEHLSLPDSSSVAVIGDCSMVVIASSLTTADVDKAVDMCNLAGEVAYVGNINAVRIVSTDGDDLASGINGSDGPVPCLPY